uniref:Uncharacterized protein n=1 Tax=Anguilla anguilla TaxID=7936 RepID=A0A0E9TQ36_ANGAN
MKYTTYNLYNIL